MIFAAGYLLGGNTNQNMHTLRPVGIQEPMDASLLPSENDLKHISDRLLIDEDMSSFSFEEEYDVMAGDDLEIYIEEQDSEEAIKDAIDYVEDEDFEDILFAEEETIDFTDEEIDYPSAPVDVHVDVEYRNRKLMKDVYHKPLTCNDGLEQTNCGSFKGFVENSNKQTTLVIPCGECFEVDYTDGTEIDLPNGLSIDGKLFFPKTANVTLRTKFVWVVGILDIDTPDDSNQVKFSLYGDELQTYTATSSESNLCTPEIGGCNLGSKVIAVVGGQLNIKGAQDDCPAWEKLTAIGPPVPRPFENHLPCEGGECWKDNFIKITGPCQESPGHTKNLGKYTVYCPIEKKALIKHGTSLGIKLTSVKGPEPVFKYPQDDSGNDLSFTMNHKCSVHGHTRNPAVNRCVVVCNTNQNVDLRSGSNIPLTFTSIVPVDNKFPMPTSKEGEEINLKVKQCWYSGGWSNRFKRCAIECKLFPTIDHRSGENSGKLEFKSKFVAESPQFPVPSENGVPGNFTLKNECAYMSGHTRAWKGCVVRCRLENTSRRFGSFHDLARLNNKNTGKFVNVKRIIHYAHAGRDMYLLLKDVTQDQCEAQGAVSLNNVFKTGDEIVPSYQISTDPSANGSTFGVDQILVYAYNRQHLIFFPSDSSRDTCGDVASEFNNKFPAGYEIEINHVTEAPGGESFNVDKVSNWAWKKKAFVFMPTKSDAGTCQETVDEFNAKFPARYSIDIKPQEINMELNQTVEASTGVHHWSWNQNALFFFPDEDASAMNKKFPVGSTLQFDYLDATDIKEIKVSSEAAECWKVGTELLLTSGTRNWKGDVVRRIISSDKETGLLTLSAQVGNPISKEESEDFAIEVASLNRGIVFEAESDSGDENIGGHLIVHHTSSSQNIQGVEVRNFGQQGNLGRYPIHFHMCGDSNETVVRRNVVRNSNQRGFVVHLTNNITLEENVAHDVFGHCFFIEDGRETGNTFRRNLGSRIKSLPGNAIELLSAQSKRDESDAPGSVFWISNANNKYYGNVAAGSEGHGYWFDTRGILRSTNLGAFEDNEVHSSRRFAFTTYSPGWRPSEVAVIKNLRVYRNPTWGALLHVTQNLHFEGGLFADNGGKAVMISRGDDIVFNGTTFIGKTEHAGVSNCRWEKTAIHLDPVRLQETVLWNFKGNKKGTTLDNVTFQNWSPSALGCESESGVGTPLKFFNHQTFIKSYSAPHVFKDLSFDSEYVVHANMPGSGIDDVQIEIVSDKNNALTNDGKGFFISTKLEKMIPTTCKDYDNGLKFCPDSCIRTVTVLAGNSPFLDDVEMVVTDANDRTREISIKKDVRHSVERGKGFFAAYTIALPKSTYEISFMEPSTGSRSWPRYAFVVPEAAPVSCQEYVDESDFTFVKPTQGREGCEELIFNGNFDGGDEGWYAHHHSYSILEGGGTNGSAALVSNLPLTQGSKISQAIDGSCLESGQEYDLSISFKLLDYNGNSNPPYVRIETQNFVDKKLQSVRANVFQSSDFNKDALDGWYTISGTWTVDDDIANAGKHVIRMGGADYKVVLDNVSLRLRADDSTNKLRRRTY